MADAATRTRSSAPIQRPRTPPRHRCSASHHPADAPAPVSATAALCPTDHQERSNPTLNSPCRPNDHPTTHRTRSKAGRDALAASLHPARSSVEAYSSRTDCLPGPAGGCRGSRTADDAGGRYRGHRDVCALPSRSFAFTTLRPGRSAATALRRAAAHRPRPVWLPVEPEQISARWQTIRPSLASFRKERLSADSDTGRIACEVATRRGPVKPGNPNARHPGTSRKTITRGCSRRPGA